MRQSYFISILIFCYLGTAVTAYEPAILYGPFASIQANVDASGADVEADSANEPSIAINPLDPTRIAIGWRQFDQTTPEANYFAGIAYSTDGGMTWSMLNYVDVLAGLPKTPRSDPVLDYSSGGRFYYYSLNRSGYPRTCDMFISTDGGQTWTMDTDPQPLGGDKAWIAVDRTGGSGNGNVYAHWNWQQFVSGQKDGCCEVYDRVTRSTDGGFTYQLPFPHSTDPNDLEAALSRGTIDVGPDGAIYAVGLRTKSTSGGSGAHRTDLVGVSKSTSGSSEMMTMSDIAQIDLGDGYNARQGMNTYDRPQFASSGFLGQWTIKADRIRATPGPFVYVLGARMFDSDTDLSPEDDQPSQIVFNRSEDGGVTWLPTGWKLPHSQSGWQWFPTMSVAPNGRIDVFIRFSHFRPPRRA